MKQGMIVKTDLLFEHKFHTFQREWLEKFNWHLFMLLSKDDEYFLTSLRIPLTNDQSEFERQVLALTKVIIESLNEAELKKRIGKSKGDKGITMLEKFLDHYQLQNFSEHVTFLRRLQNLRNRVVHKKGKDDPEVSAYFQLDEKDLSDVFDSILTRAISFLDYLRENFLIELVPLKSIQEARGFLKGIDTTIEREPDRL